MAKVCTIVWVRRDLRIEDNPALYAAARAGSVVPVFIWSPEEEGQFHSGRVSRWWLTQSLIQLDISLRSLGVLLVMRKTTDTLSVLLELVQTTGASQVFYNHLYDPVSLVRDHHVKQGLAERGIQVQSFNGDLLYEPWEVYDERGKPFTSFESCWQKCLNMPFEPESPLLPPRRLIAAGILQWGTAPGTKQVTNLWIELIEGEIVLEDTHPPKRTVHVASVKIKNEAGQMLVEAHQEMADGSIRPRNRPLSEKMRRGEKVEEANLLFLLYCLLCLVSSSKLFKKAY